MHISLNGHLIDTSQPSVMGILNVTPDSFHDGGKYISHDNLAERIEKIIDDGASFIDIGAHSTKPNAHDVDPQEEIDRILPAAKLARELSPTVPISIDTFRSEVLQNVFDAIGPVVANDISSGRFDKEMIATVANLKLPYICTHCRGSMQTMHQQYHYSNVTLDIIDHFAQMLALLRESGINDVICDPGFGFSKTIDQNFELLRNLESFKILNSPILVGLSRKSMIWKTLATSHDHALNGTTALNLFALQKGASILRVHDVKEAMELIKLNQKLQTN